jgi:hypothetical protein
MSKAQSLPNLRPLSLGELLDQAIRLYRRNFFKFIGIIAIVQIPITIIGLVISLVAFGDFFQRIADPSSLPNSTNPLEVLGPDYFSAFGVTILVGIISGLLLAIAMGALTRLVADSYLGESIGTIEAYLRIENRLLPLIWTLIVNLIFGILMFIWLLIPCIGWLTGPGILGMIGYIVIPLTVPVVILEKYSGFSALRRGWELVRHRFWWVIGFAFILYLFSQLVVGGPAAIVSLIFQYLLPDAMTSGNADSFLRIQSIIQTVVQLVFSLLYQPLQLTCMTLLYFDLRVRLEGLDLAFMAEEGNAQVISASKLVAQSPPMPSGSLITMNEMGSFVLLTVGGAVVIGLGFFILGLLGLMISGGAAGGF